MYNFNIDSKFKCRVWVNVLHFYFPPLGILPHTVRSEIVFYLLSKRPGGSPEPRIWWVLSSNQLSHLPSSYIHCSIHLYHPNPCCAPGTGWHVIWITHNTHYTESFHSRNDAGLWVMFDSQKCNVSVVFFPIKFSSVLYGSLFPFFRLLCVYCQQGCN